MFDGAKNRMKVLFIKGSFLDCLSQEKIKKLNSIVGTYRPNTDNDFQQCAVRVIKENNYFSVTLNKHRVKVLEIK